MKVIIVGGVAGGGFIGLEMAKNLKHLGLEVTLIQRGPHVMTPIDPEMARYVERHMEKHGVHLVLNDGATGFQQSANGSLEVLTESGEKYSGDVVVMGIGVRPESWLAKEAGLEVGERGGIRVDEQMIARQFARLHWIMWKAGMKEMWDRMD